MDADLDKDLSSAVQAALGAAEAVAARYDLSSRGRRERLVCRRQDGGSPPRPRCRAAARLLRPAARRWLAARPLAFQFSLRAAGPLLGFPFGSHPPGGSVLLDKTESSLLQAIVRAAWTTDSCTLILGFTPSSQEFPWERRRRGGDEDAPAPPALVFHRLRSGAGKEGSDEESSAAARALGPLGALLSARLTARSSPLAEMALGAFDAPNWFGPRRPDPLSSHERAEFGILLDEVGHPDPIGLMAALRA